MRVLHVHTVAYIPEFLVSQLKKKGVEAEFAEEVKPGQVKNYDIIHGHYALNRHTIKAFREARRFEIPFILHCHGSDVRRLAGTGRKKLPIHYNFISNYMRKRSAKILLATPDLLGFAPGGEYLPNPVNLDVFRPMPEVEKSSKVLIIGKQIKGSKLPEFIEPGREYDCVNTGYQFDFPKNVRVLPYVKRDQFPRFLNQYKDMIGAIGDVISMARLEAMACGLKTFTDFEQAFSKYYDGQNPDKVENPRNFIERFHKPDIAVKKLIEVYEALSRS